MNLKGKVGPQKLSDGVLSEIRINRSGDVVVSQGHEELVLEEKVFIGANLGGTPVTTQAGLSATTPALTLYNPVGSGVNLVPLSVTIDIKTAPAAAAAPAIVSCCIISPSLMFRSSSLSVRLE